MLGKTVTTEFALRHPGPTANPHNPAHTPGGSSSGSAAAVADFMVPVAFGTQTGGSIIRPASYCGVVGYKPSFNTINPTGVKPLAGSFDTVGLFARSVDDCALVVGVLAGDDAQRDSARRPSGQHAWASGGRPPGATPKPRRSERSRPRRSSSRARACIVDEIELPAEFELFLDAQSDVLRFEAARVFAFERTRRADLLSPSSREELAGGRGDSAAPLSRSAGLACPLPRAVRGRDRAVRRAVDGERARRSARRSRQHRRGDVQPVELGPARSVPQSAGLHRTEGIAGRRSADRRIER